MQKVVFFIFFAALFAIGCTKEDRVIETTGTVIDYTGRLDGCSVMINLDDGGKIEIISLPAGITLIPNRRVKIKYEAEPRISICMAGITAYIKSLRYI